VSISKKRHLIIAAKKENLVKIREFTQKTGRKFGLNAKQLGRFKMSVDEICTNVVLYAYRGIGEKGKIHIELIKTGSQVGAKIVDTGVEFDYAAVQEPNLHRHVQEGKKGGFGIQLVKKLNDVVEYKREGDKNVLTFFTEVEPGPTFLKRIRQSFQCVD
jgi:serine/threonine-protein kinase RsbW